MELNHSSLLSLMFMLVIGDGIEVQIQIAKLTGSSRVGCAGHPV